MRLFLGRARQSVRQHVWQRVRAIVDLFHLLPLVAAGIIVLLFAFVGQLYELYYSYIDEHAFWPILWAFIALSALSALLHASHYWLSRVRETVIFKTYTRPNIGMNYRRFRRAMGCFIAFCPWLGLAIGLGLAGHGVIEHQVLLNKALGLVHTPVALVHTPVEERSTFELLLMVGIVVTLVVLVGVTVVAAIDLLRRNNVVLALLLAFVGALIVFTAFLGSDW
jgi:hypothetical protein